MSTLRRTQIYFPEDMLMDLKRRAQEGGTTIAGVVREAISEFLKKEEEKDWERDPLWRMVGSSCSKEGDLSVRHDKYLYGRKG